MGFDAKKNCVMGLYKLLKKLFVNLHALLI
jgi:hypothetical protein